jgi:uncharacterized iron-regulated membrane protein
MESTDDRSKEDRSRLVTSHKKVLRRFWRRHHAIFEFVGWGTQHSFSCLQGLSSLGITCGARNDRLTVWISRLIPKKIAKSQVADEWFTTAGVNLPASRLKRFREPIRPAYHLAGRIF